MEKLSACRDVIRLCHKVIFLAAFGAPLMSGQAMAAESNDPDQAVKAKLDDWVGCVLEAPVMSPGSVESIVEKAMQRCQWREDSFEEAWFEKEYPETRDISQAPPVFKEGIESQRKSVKAAAIEAITTSRKEREEIRADPKIGKTYTAWTNCLTQFTTSFGRQNAQVETIVNAIMYSCQSDENRWRDAMGAISDSKYYIDQFFSSMRSEVTTRVMTLQNHPPG